MFKRIGKIALTPVGALASLAAIIAALYFFSRVKTGFAENFAPSVALETITRQEGKYTLTYRLGSGALREKRVSRVVDYHLFDEEGRLEPDTVAELHADGNAVFLRFTLASAKPPPFVMFTVYLNGEKLYYHGGSKEIDGVIWRDPTASDDAAKE